MKDENFGQFFSNIKFLSFSSCILLALSAFQAAAVADQGKHQLPAASRSGESCLLKSSRAAGAIDRVTVQLEAGGEVKFVENKKVGREKMSVAAELGYHEKTLGLSDNSTQGESEAADKDSGGAVGGLRSLRYYDKAEAVIKVGKSGIKPTLDDERRLIAVDAGEQVALFSPLGPLTREELDLLEALGDSLLLDRLLPARAASEGDSWDHSSQLLAALLGLDKIADCDVKSKLETLSDTSAMMTMEGRVEGAVEGVTTRMEIKAKYRFIRKTGRIDWFGMLVKEDRDIGHVNTGVELVARVQVQIKPDAACAQLTEKSLAGLLLEPSEEMSRLVFRSKTGGWEFYHDRRWIVTADERSHAVLRLVDRGELIAQCNVTNLAEVKPGKQVTLEEFQEDVKEALGESFGGFENASQQPGGDNYRVLRVVAGGESSQLPIQWIYYLIANEQGRQVALTFTVEKTHSERLANADRALAETLRFTQTIDVVAVK